MSKPVHPVVTEVHAQQGQDPGPRAIPGEGDYVEVFVGP